MEKYVIIGGVAAGTKAAAKLRRLKPDSLIDIYTMDTHVSYSTCGFPYFIGGNFNEESYLFARTVQEFENSKINIHLKQKCDEIIPEKKQISVNGLEVSYDKLLIAIGASPVLPDIKNKNLKNIFTLRHVEDAISIKEMALKSSHATIIGGGYIGIELLEAFVNRGLNVTLVEASSVIMPIFDDDISTIIQAQVLENCNNCIDIINNDIVIEFFGQDYVKGVKTKKGQEFETDFVVICTGVKPNIDIAKNCGIEIGKTGAIKVNESMETSIENIYAAGDCVEKFHIVARQPCWLPLASTAIKEGRCAAINMSGSKEFFYGVLGSAVTKYFNFSMAITGLNEKDAKKYGFEPVSVTITKSDKVDYMPDAQKITIKVVADNKTKALLGAQAIGYGNVDKRINTVVSALNCHITVKEFMKNDIPYSPAFSTSIDPILTAFEKLMNKLY